MSLPPTTGLNQAEFVARQDIAERQACSPLWGVVYSIFTAGIGVALMSVWAVFMAFSSVDDHWELLRIGFKTILPWLVLLLGSLPFADWWWKRGLRKMGLDCPKCRELLLGESGQGPAATGLCGKCGTRIFDQQDAVAGSPTPGVCMGCGQAPAPEGVKGFDVCAACLEPQGAAPKPLFGENYPPYWWGAAMSAWFLGAIGAGVAAGIAKSDLGGLFPPKAEQALEMVRGSVESLRQSWRFVVFSAAAAVILLSPSVYRRFGFWATLAFWPALGFGYYGLLRWRIRTSEAEVERQRAAPR